MYGALPGVGGGETGEQTYLFQEKMSNFGEQGT